MSRCPKNGEQKCVNILILAPILKPIAMKIFQSLLLIFSVIALTTSCKKNEPDTQSPASKLRGKVELQDKYGNVELTGRAGTQAVLGGPFQNHTETTDNSGRFEFSEIGDNTYSLTVSREGYTPVVLYNINFSQNSPLYPVNGDYQELPTVVLAQQSVSYFDSTIVDDLYNVEITIDTINDTIYTFIDTLSADLYFRSLRVFPESFNPQAKFGYRLFLGKNTNVGPANYLATYHMVTNGQENVVERLWTQSQWQNIGFNFDEPIFIKIYGDAVNPITHTTINGQSYFPNLSDSLAMDSTTILSFQ